MGAPVGVAIDPARGRIYWANFNSWKISFAKLDGTGGGGQLPTTGAILNKPMYPSILLGTAGAGTPAISGGSAPGAALTCSTGSWAPDQVGALLYRAPQTFACSWTRDGSPIAGSGNSIRADAPGSYACEVTATNFAGSAAQTSAARAVIANAFTIGRAKLNKKKGSAKLTVTVPGPGELALSGTSVVAQRLASASSGDVELTVKGKGKARKKLRKKGGVKVAMTITFAPTGGEGSTQTKKLKLKRKRSR